MGKMKTFRVTVEMDVTVRTDKTKDAVEKALGVMTDRLSARNTPAGESEFSDLVQSISIYKED